MTTPFTIDLQIFIPGSGRGARDVIGMYLSSIVQDIDQTAWNLLDCSEDRMVQEFSDLALQDSNFTPNHKDGFEINARFAVSAAGPDFIDRVFEEYMQAFSDWIDETLREYFSRTGKRADLVPTSFNWVADIAAV